MASLAASCGVIPIAADLAQTEMLPRLAETVLEQLGQVDVLVNNAACSYINLFQCMPPEQVRRLYAVNLTAVVELSRLLLPSMISRHTGCIVNISSMWGETGASCEVDYSVTKGAVLAFTRALAKEVGPSGIRDPGRTGKGNTSGTAGKTGGCGGCGTLSGVRPGGVYHRTGYPGERRFLVRLTGGRESVDLHPNTGNLSSATCTKPCFAADFFRWNVQIP